MSDVGPNVSCPYGCGLPHLHFQGSVLRSPGEIPLDNGDPNASEEQVSLGGFPETYQMMYMHYLFMGDGSSQRSPVGRKPGSQVWSGALPAQESEEQMIQMCLPSIRNRASLGGCERREGR